MSIGHNEFAVPRLPDHFSLLHDHFPSDDRMRYFPFYPSAMISVQLTLGIDFIGVDGPLSIEVTDCKIGIRVREDRAFAGIEAENLGPINGSDLSKLLQTDISFIKNRAKYPTCKGGDESPRAEGTKNMI